MQKFFIVGCPRSGTTVLQQALNRHSQVVIPPETKFFYYFYGKPRSRQVAHLQRINRDLGIQLPAPNTPLRHRREARLFYERMAITYLERLGRNGVAYFGDKTPEHTGQLHRIREVFPEAKVLFLYRDGRDVALSLSRMPWIDCDVYVGFVIWLYYYRILRRQRENPWFDMLFVRYEDLVSDPAGELRRVLEFLELDYEPQVAEGYGNREGIPERELLWKARALERISTDRVGLWRRELPPLVVKRLERLGAGALEDLGYRLSGYGNGRLPPWFLARLAWGIARCALRLPLCCLVNELAGSAYRFLRSGSRQYTEAGRQKSHAGTAENQSLAAGAPSRCDGWSRECARQQG